MATAIEVLASTHSERRIVKSLQTKGSKIIFPGYCWQQFGVRQIFIK
jgi:hypothetical protein